VSEPRATALFALDWGTTSARVYRLSGDGQVLGVREAPLGVQQVRNGAFPAALQTLLGDWADDPAPRLASGMIGSRQGWVEAPYVECPADPATLAERLCRTPGGEMTIVPGLICRDAEGVPDVIRGEETQIAGAIDADEGSVLAILPGTHSKWVRIDAGRIERFATYMTGELYAVLMAHSILGRLSAAPAAPGSGTQSGKAFARGVERGLHGPGLSHAIFGARTLALTGGLEASDVGDWLSGVLIGHEIKAGRAQLGADGAAMLPVRIIGTDALGARYVQALAQAGIAAARGPADAAARGLFDVAQRARLL
jgi:2-dehydro-3-deoxygalactonokinase